MQTKEKCREQVVIRGATFGCSGIHGPRAYSHRVVEKDSTRTFFVFVEWKTPPQTKEKVDR